MSQDSKVSEDRKGKKIVLKKGALPIIFKWFTEKRPRSTFVSKGKRRGQDLEAPQKKRQTKELPTLQINLHQIESNNLYLKRVTPITMKYSP